MTLNILYYFLQIILTVLVIFSIWWYTRRPKNAPPGPWGMPLLGYVPFIPENPGNHFMQLSKKYNSPVVCYDQGPSLAIVLNSYETIKKAYHDMADSFLDRPKYFGPMFMEGQNSFVFSNGPKWKEHRRFFLTTLRDFGMGRRSMENWILEETHYFVEAIKKMKGKAFDIDVLITSSFSNITSLIDYGKRFDYDDQSIIDLKKNRNDSLKACLLYMFAPLCEKLVGTKWWTWLPGYQIMHDCVKVNEDFAKKLIDEHIKEYYPGKNDDYIDAYLTEREKRKQNGNNPELFDDVTLLSNVRLLHISGSETTNIALRWGILLLAVHQDIQKKIQAEVDRVVGRERRPALTDRVNMNYLEAFYTEMNRMYPLAPMYDPHMTTEDIMFEGHFVPKDTVVHGNIWAVHYDEKLWPDPHTFRPERFLDDEGKMIKTEKIITFGVGKRNCAGESITRSASFLYLASLAQNFNVLPPEGKHASLQGKVGWVYNALPYELRFVERDC